ncbi:hypothetical protein DXF96_10490 [Heyndrickxia coagulans]|nr:hypothetical protein C3766_04785 [Heyndrickxia coagulans]AWP36366.1 hypothetical protein CYJ15_04935 [Heyndrickxia coagulans]KYC73631.1 hypothetical protein B4096_0371 [Heyndrickxia coagulans]QDI61871.1 hypothetical protein DXF96_10490 [Heyndrickxia coagulans]
MLKHQRCRPGFIFPGNPGVLKNRCRRGVPFFSKNRGGQWLKTPQMGVVLKPVQPDDSKDWT